MSALPSKMLELAADAETCPVCGSDDLQIWAEDPNTDDADFWECERCESGGDVSQGELEERIDWDAEPVVGERASGTLVGSRGRHSWAATFSGVYRGLHEHEDGPVHFLEDGIVGKTPQTSFAFPVREPKA